MPPFASLKDCSGTQTSECRTPAASWKALVCGRPSRGPGRLGEGRPWFSLTPDHGKLLDPHFLSTPGNAWGTRRRAVASGSLGLPHALDREGTGRDLKSHSEKGTPGPASGRQGPPRAWCGGDSSSQSRPPPQWLRATHQATTLCHRHSDPLSFPHFINETEAQREAHLDPQTSKRPCRDSGLGRDSNSGDSSQRQAEPGPPGRGLKVQAFLPECKGHLEPQLLQKGLEVLALERPGGPPHG